MGCLLRVSALGLLASLTSAAPLPQRVDVSRDLWISSHPTEREGNNGGSPRLKQDCWALRRFGLEFWRGVAAHPGARFTFRADISRPEWQRDLLENVRKTPLTTSTPERGVNRTLFRSSTRRTADRCRACV